mmetsp:Transcript_61253/g.138189  ORF Transcript_61253/g.138189 Transcript_61253/m.138189 type:complete len:291 (-) Transcript_61253:91-963(-)
MGCCQDKELLIVCSWDWDYEYRPRSGDERIHLRASKAAAIAASTRAAASTDGGSCASRAAGGPPPGRSVGRGIGEDGEGGIGGSGCGDGSALDAPPVTAAPLPVLVADQAANQEEAGDISELLLLETFYLTGKFAGWSASFPEGRLMQDSAREGMARLRLCVRLTSSSFSFQVVSSKRQWTWRLYPKDAKNIRFTHASKEGHLQVGDPDAVVVGVGNLKVGHGLNFHIVEPEGTVLTVWVEVPVSVIPDGLALEDLGQGARVWYTIEDTGVQYTGGDGIDLMKYKWMALG